MIEIAPSLLPSSIGIIVNVPYSLVRSGCVEVTSWTVDRAIRVRFPAYPHRVSAL